MGQQEPTNHFPTPTPGIDHTNLLPLTVGDLAQKSYPRPDYPGGRPSGLRPIIIILRLVYYHTVFIIQGVQEKTYAEFYQAMKTPT